MVFRRARRVGELINHHLELVEQTVRKSREALSAYLDEGLEEADKLGRETHRLEAQADNARRQAALELMGGALLASMRGEFLELIERADRVANLAESVLYFALLQRIAVPGPLKPLVKEIGKRTAEEMMAEVRRAIRALFTDRGQVLEHTKAVEELESEIDLVERRAVEEIFQLDLGLAERLQLREFVSRLADISDGIEDISDQVEIIVATRRA
ncbi:MAG: DUF47 domain-containing protein [Candidatus Bipolaricaulia bacterium]